MKTPLIIGALTIAVVMSALGVVYVKHQSRKLFVELNVLETERDRLNVEWGQLQLELNTWAAHGRIENKARKNLGMTGIKQDKVIFIKP
ncbi:MAG: cell division protein FtsL [Gammaproteobacteria bacterium]|jgi:cell division protein FtsL